jgi:fluoroquinolone transport system permease protein
MKAILAFGKNDARNISRDSLLLYVIAIPWVMVVLTRLLVPALTTWLAEQVRFDLVPYYPLILSFFFVLEIPMLFGLVFGLLILDERDDNTLTALRVTPFSMTSYLLYRMMVASGLSIGYVLVLLPLTGMMDIGLLPATVPIAVLTGLLAPILALLLVSFASNKVEGLALMKASGILLLGPLAAYFITSQWQLLLGILPGYWPAKAFWVASEGGNMWPYLIVGFVYYAVLIGWFQRRFQHNLAKR